MPKKEGYYIETNCLQWLNSNIAYENASIRVAWQTLRCEYFVALQNAELYTIERAIKHRDLNRKKVQYLIDEGYVKLEEETYIKIEDVFHNSEKIKDISAKRSDSSNVRWKNRKVKSKEADVFYEIQEDEIF